MDFTYQKLTRLIAELDRLRVRNSIALDGFRYLDCGYKGEGGIPNIDESWKKFQHGERWGETTDSHRWFYKRLVLPEQMRQKQIRFRVLTGREGEWDANNPQFICYLDGKIVQGMDVNHTAVRLPEGDAFDLYLYAYSGMKAGPVEFLPSLEEPDPVCETLYYHLKTPLDVAAFLEPDSRDFKAIMTYLNRAANLVDLREPGSEASDQSLRNAVRYMEEEFYGTFCREQEVTTVCIGHTHIDVAWQWTLAQTREKAQRSFSTVVKLMEEYPEYKFMSSQPQLYQYVKRDCPELYERIRELIKEGRWEAEGAMWLEADCNLTSGESLVRQILFGKRFFQKEFGIDNRILWLPDVFGYSAALPQILQKCGVDTFVTSKISWNETNQMPYDTFRWQGIDGTEIFTYFLTAQDKKRGEKPVRYTTYVGNITPEQVAGTWDRYQQKELSDETLLTFGYGDGGGGPTCEMLETQRRLEKGIAGCPQTKIDTATNFIKRLKTRAEADPRLPKWTGELYLELHRGTYTSIAKNKKNNRKSELLYQTAELLAAMDKTLLEGDYPQETLNNGWETILLNQFHDIIPGSSIREVYEDSDAQYAEVLAAGGEIADGALSRLAAQVKTDGGLLVFNPHSFTGNGVVEVDGTHVFVENIPAKGYRVVSEPAAATSVVAEERYLENDFFRIQFDEAMTITSLYDKRAKREVIPQGQRANVLEAYEDLPYNWDAWEVSSYYREKMWEINDVSKQELVRDGARSGIRVTRRFLSSVVEQTVWVYDGVERIDFETNLDWRQEHILVKAAFPVEVYAEKATYDIQFGSVERPTHMNTSWDAAKFEVCAHKFADLSEYDYGVSLMNDCKYGYDVHDGVMRLTLLKCATDPNPDADKGTHSFTYALYPHLGGFQAGGTVQSAYELNLPMRAVRVPKQDGVLADRYSFMEIDAENIIAETVKKAEDSDALIVRLYDCCHMRSNPELRFGFDVRRAALCDMLENELEQLEVRDNRVKISVRPFEIVTLKIEQ